MVKAKNEIGYTELRVLYDPWKWYRFQSQKEESTEKSFILDNSTLGCDTVWTLYQGWLNSLNQQNS